MENRGLVNSNNFEENGKSWFFGIGVNQYKDQGFNGLFNAVKDVRDVLNRLDAMYEVDKFILLEDQNATKSNILKELNNLRKLVKPSDKLLIYFSGHGYLSEIKKNGYWIPFDAEKESYDTYLPNDTLKNYVGEIGSKHTLVIADACFAGTMIKNRKKSLDFDNQVDKLKSRHAFCSGREDEEVLDGIPNENSPFAKSILKVLRTNTQPSVRVTEFVNQVINNLKYPEKLPKKPKPIYGIIDYDDDEGGEYIFRLQKSEEEIWKECLEKNNKDSYLNYLNLFLDGAFVNEASNHIKQISESITSGITEKRTYFLPRWLKKHFWKGTTILLLILLSLFTFQYFNTPTPPKESNNPGIDETGLADADDPVQQEDTISDVEGDIKKPEGPINSSNPPGGDTKKPRKINTSEVSEVETEKESWRSKVPLPFINKDTFEMQLFGNTVWLTENIRYNAPRSGAWCANNNKVECSENGMLFTFSTAKQICNDLGKGWRVASLADWEERINYYGGIYEEGASNLKDISPGARKAFDALILGGKSGLDIRLGGYLHSDHKDFDKVDTVGIYWTNTKVDESTIWVIGFSQERNFRNPLYKARRGKNNGYFCRCVYYLDAN